MTKGNTSPGGKKSIVWFLYTNSHWKITEKNLFLHQGEKELSVKSIVSKVYDKPHCLKFFCLLQDLSYWEEGH